MWSDSSTVFSVLLLSVSQWLLEGLMIRVEAEGTTASGPVCYDWSVSLGTLSFPVRPSLGCHHLLSWEADPGDLSWDQGGCGSDLASRAPLVHLRVSVLHPHLHTWELRPSREQLRPQAYSGRTHWQRHHPQSGHQKGCTYYYLIGVKHGKHGGEGWCQMNPDSEWPKKDAHSPFWVKIFFKI